MCPACYKYFMKNNKWYDKEREKICENVRFGIMNNLILYSSIIGKNPTAFEYMKNVVII